MLRTLGTSTEMSWVRSVLGKKCLDTVCHWYICRHAARSSALHYAGTRCSEVHFSPQQILPRFRFPTFPTPRCSLILHRPTGHTGAGRRDLILHRQPVEYYATSLEEAVGSGRDRQRPLVPINLNGPNHNALLAVNRRCRVNRRLRILVLTITKRQ